MKKILILAAFAAVLFAGPVPAQEVNPNVDKVHVIFKTHLDIGFTQLSSVVEQRYIDEFIPKAIAVAEQLRAENGEARYVWTTGSWLVDAYLKQAAPDAVRTLEDAIRRGDIVWNGMPYTVESESMTPELFATVLKLSQRLDKRFGKTTIAAKMTDVPGHTRGIVSPLYDAGMRFLQIGVNSAATVPDVPPVCLWRNTDGKQIVLMYQKTYGDDMILPDEKTAVSINFTNDNKGPHTIARVKEIYAGLHKRYPNARIVASSLNDVAADLQTMTDRMPVLTSEIGDTWIYGYGSAPVRMSRYRALSRLYTQWVREGRIDMNSDQAIDFAVRLGMIAEHTWGVDVKVFLKNWDKYDVDIFNASRDLKEFRFMEQSWKEIDDNVDKAIAMLPVALQQEATQALQGIGAVEKRENSSKDKAPGLDSRGAYTYTSKGTKLTMGEIAYQSFSAADYERFQNAYLTRKPQWAIEDNGKPGLENSKARSATLVAALENCTVEKTKAGRKIACRVAFADDARVDSRVLPEDMYVDYFVPAKGDYIEMNVSLLRKLANRMPEAYWVSFIPSQVTAVMAEKLGCPVDVTDVVSQGNRQMHAIDNYADIVTDKGTFRIVSLDAPLMAVGERNALNFSTAQPDLSKGIHFCLFNNLWGTNFTMWFEGSVTFRFRIERLS